jgi:hypothetical protein
MTNIYACQYRHGLRKTVAMVAACLVLPGGHAAAAEAATATAHDLSPGIVHHVARCPSPAQGKCIIRKPVGTGYRLLTPGVDLEDGGDDWIVDFGKTRNGKTAPALLRIMDRHEQLHEIEVSFPSEPAVAETAPATPTAKQSAAKKSAKRQPAKKPAATPAPG